jgi:hypothetical protein
MNIPPDEGYPMSTDRCPRRLIASGKGKRGEIREQLERLQELSQRKRSITDASGSPSESVDYDLYGRTMAERRRREAEGL